MKPSHATPTGKSRLSIVIPCFNEAENADRLPRALGPVLQVLGTAHDVELVLVDDGSDDDTWDRLNAAFSDIETTSLDVKFCRHLANMGLGAAIRTGFKASRGDIVITTDSDGTYAFEMIPDVINLLNRGADVVTASPYHPEGGVEGVPPYRLVLSKGSSLIYRILLDPSIHTYTSLFRGYRRRVLDEVEFHADDFLAGTEILVKAWFAGFKISEYPAVLRIRSLGSSKARILRTILSHLRFQLWVLRRRLGIQTPDLRAKGEQSA